MQTLTEPTANGSHAPIPPPRINGARQVQRRRQTPWVVLGVLMVAGGALGFALWSQGQSARTPVVVAGVDIDAGHLITRADLIAVPMAADTGVRLLPATAIDALLGQTAAAPIPAGTPIQQAMLATDGDVVPAGSAIVGMSLVPGQYPVSSIAPGSTVRLFELPVSGVDGGGEVELGTGTIWSVEAIDSVGEPRLFIGVLVDADLAGPVANAAGADRIRLVLAPGAGS